MRPTPEFAIPARWSTVDLLRGFAIIAVVLRHIDIRIHLRDSAVGALLPLAAWRWLSSGYYGVKVFLVVSGFLITTTMLRRWGRLDCVQPLRFYWLRFARLGPCLLALLVVGAVLHLAHVEGLVIDPSRSTLTDAVFAALTFHLNQLEIRHGYLPALWDVLWSLSVEEVFYLAYPLLWRMLRRIWMMCALALVLIAIGPFARTIWAGSDHSLRTEMQGEYGYLANIDCLAIGCLAAMIIRHRASYPHRRWLQAIGVVLLLAKPLFKIPDGLDVTYVAAATALVLLGMEHTARGSWVSAPIRWFGRNSYEVYLTHGFFTVFGRQFYKTLGEPIQSAPMWHAGILALSGLTGWVVAVWFSEPMNRWLRERRVLRQASESLRFD